MLLVLAGCGSSGLERTDDWSRAAIIGGTATDADPAVVMLVSYPADHSSYDTCTASLVSPTVLLTAAHCVDRADAGFGVFFGSDATAYQSANTLIPQLAAVSEVHAHPQYQRTAPFTADIGVVVLAAPPSVAPLAVNRQALDATWQGRAARIVGYGQKQYGQYNARKYEAATTVGTVAGDTVTVGDLMVRSCVGDSGGPALVTVGGVETIIGVDSYTELTGCLEAAHYRRTDSYAAFLEPYLPAVVVPPVDAGVGPAEAPKGCSVASGAGPLLLLFGLLRRRRVTGR